MTSTFDQSSTCPDRVIGRVFREEWGRLLSLLVSRTRRLDLAEDALGEAFARASARWASDGVPANPSGWIYATAYRHIIDRLRAEAVAGRKVPLLAVTNDRVEAPAPTAALGDDRLDLILLCCHPALAPESRSALALRLVVGTSTEQIARLFLVPQATMAARLTRAKRKIVGAGIPIGVPIEEELRTRLDEVCRTIYLAFTAGYTPGAGPDLLRADLAGDAVHLAQMLHHLVADAAQVRAMLALLMIQHARRDARLHDGRLVTLADQDRTMWHHDEMRSALTMLGVQEPSTGYAEELRLQALIAAEHAIATNARDTNWPAIAHHYDALEELTGSAIVRLNRAVAVGEADGPLVGIAVLEGLDHVFADDHRLPAVRGDLARRAGDVALARHSYRSAIERCGNDVERAHLISQLESLPASDSTNE